MSIRNQKREEIKRLECKQLDARFLQTVQVGLGCSPFEAEAVLQVARDVYAPYMDEAATMAPPGGVTVVAVAAEEPAGKPVEQCEKRTVCLTVHRGAEDDRILREEGPTAFRRSRLADLAQQALSQGALLTREDLAAHVFFISARTISRDLAALRRSEPRLVVPLRGAIQDIGPALTHRVEIVRLALEGKTTSEIRDRTRHSPPAISNYVSTFTRCAQLARKGMGAPQIAFLLRRGRGLVEKYLALLAECEADEALGWRLEELLTRGFLEGGEKEEGKGGEHGG